MVTKQACGREIPGHKRALPPAVADCWGLIGCPGAGAPGAPTIPASPLRSLLVAVDLSLTRKAHLSLLRARDRLAQQHEHQHPWWGSQGVRSLKAALTCSPLGGVLQGEQKLSWPHILGAGQKLRPPGSGRMNSGEASPADLGQMQLCYFKCRFIRLNSTYRL